MDVHPLLEVPASLLHGSPGSHATAVSRLAGVQQGKHGSRVGEGSGECLVRVWDIAPGMAEREAGTSSRRKAWKAQGEGRDGPCRQARSIPQ
jgi:hypothetical protein